MTDMTSRVVRPVGDLWDWWQMLTEDQRDLLRITASSLPLSSHVVDFLVWSDCPAVTSTDDGQAAALPDPARFCGFVRHA
jgi:hypothetical protein